jgi:hypothetical protein
LLYNPTYCIHIIFLHSVIIYNTTTDDNNNNDNNGEGHNEDDGDASDGDEEHPKEYVMINPGNVHEENLFDWNEINHEIINGINGPVAMRPIGNMHINEDKYFGFGKHGYNRADEIPNDDYYNDVDNDHGKENGNKGGCNNDSNNRGEGGASGTMVGGNNDATSIGNGDGEPSNTSQEEPIEEGPNQAVEL